MNRYKLRVEDALKAQTKGSPLSKACSYSLLSGGKRLRPILTLITAEAIGDLDVMPAAMGVEFFHTSSLIADDLPCMDNDSMRRGKAASHVKFDEATAILASYSLIASGYGSIYQNAQVMRKNEKFSKEADKRAMICLDTATRCAENATEGQYFDLYPKELGLEVVRDVIYKKTVTLFEVSLLFGWLFGGGEMALIPQIKKCAYHLGIAFQVADDLDDDVQDKTHAGVNVASILGRERALELFEREMGSLKGELKELRLWTQPFQELYETLLGSSKLFC